MWDAHPCTSNGTKWFRRCVCVCDMCVRLRHALDVTPHESRLLQVSIRFVGCTHGACSVRITVFTHWHCVALAGRIAISHAPCTGTLLSPSFDGIRAKWSTTGWAATVGVLMDLASASLPLHHIQSIHLASHAPTPDPTMQSMDVFTRTCIVAVALETWHASHSAAGMPQQHAADGCTYACQWAGACAVLIPACSQGPERCCI